VLKDRDNQSSSSSDASTPNAQGAGAGTSISSSGGSIPAISLPKGGGAILGIGEKIAANPVTGTAALTVPLATSPGRSGFGPQLSLSYDSGAGNGPFGFGWSLSLPAITRKTDKGLPRYWDSLESDVFILSGSEDLVPVLAEVNGEWQHETLPTRILGGENYRVQRYRPRIEGLFARVERWTDVQTGETHWRSITRDNVTTLYGKDDNSRIFAPADSNQPRREFSWLICQSYDDKGNAIVYEYETENAQNVDQTQANERSRTRTINRYLKRIKYGNKVSRLVQPDLSQMEWMFEVVFDYEEGHYGEVDLNPLLTNVEQHRFVLASASAAVPWVVRPDPFSSYRAGFEVRTYRRCRRVLMFHHFDELAAEPYLVRSTEFEYADFDYSLATNIEEELAHQGSSRFGSFVRSITQSGFVRDDAQALVKRDGVEYATYLKKSLPPLELEYSKANIQEDVRELDESSLENLPVGLDGSTYQWVDLDGEGISGILTDQADAWFYKPNLGDGHFGPLEVVALKPSLANLGSGSQQLIDLAGDGQLDLVTFAGPTPGFYERTQDESWETFRTFRSLPNIRWDDPNLRFLDLTGDGHADILITEDEVLTWYPSLAEEGFDSPGNVRKPFDEERGPRLVLGDGTQSIYLADMCGDGLTALVRIRNGEVCYWPNLGYGRFGAKVTMDHAPWFDHPDQFDQKRIRLADIDGSGTTDIIYLHGDGVRIYFNQSGNRWSHPPTVPAFPRIDSQTSVTVIDLLGNGTACLVWSSPLPGDDRRPMRYIDLMGGQKPHLLVKTVNNLGAESVVHYAPSTQFYLQDQYAGNPWITKLPFPVHVVERVETYDRISRNRFVTRYAYHHGYFDGVEREFRGFGMVEQWDTEEFATLSADGLFPAGTNIDASSHVPPVLTRTWFHTGTYLGRDHISDFFAGLLDSNNTGEYYREPGLTDAQARALLLDDTVLPVGLTIEEEREACRALKGSMLRQEVYARDGTAREQHPYSVTEQNFTIGLLQPRGDNRHAVFFTHARQAISYHYERNPADPRTTHALTLDVDEFGNVLKSAAIGYGRRQPDPSLPLQVDRGKQTQTLITYTENGVTNPVEAADDHRTPLPCETRTYELTGYAPTGAAGRYQISDFVQTSPSGLMHIFDSEINYEDKPTNGKQRRLIEQVRTLYRKNDLTDHVTLGVIESLALTFESYKLAFTPGLLSDVYGATITPADLRTLLHSDEGGYTDLDSDGHWWIPAGRMFFAPAIPNPRQLEPTTADAALELLEAQQHFFLPRRYRDPFLNNTVVDYDANDLLVTNTRDPLGNTTHAEINYRVLQPWRMTDPNGNHGEAAFDTLGLVVATALIGKNGEGDLLQGFNTDLTQAELEAFFAAPRPANAALLGNATTRILYAVNRWQSEGKPSYAATLARETHVSDLLQNTPSKIQVSLSYSDGFGREIQKKIQAENGALIEGGAVVDPRWVGSGWTIFNNKGKPFRQYEPFFDDTHDFKFGKQVGVSPTLFYDPAERVVATLHPNHTYEKVVFDPWQQTSWDVNDTLKLSPKTDPDVSGFFTRLLDVDYLPTWYTRMSASADTDEKNAALRTEPHANSPSIAHFDALGRQFLTIADNGFEQDGTPILFPTRVELDIEGNQRSVTDALGRIVMSYDYGIAGPEKDKETANRIHQSSMEAGERWMLSDVTSKPIRAWDSRGHEFRSAYDALRRPIESYMRQGGGPELMVGRTVYGETRPNPEVANLRGKVVQQFDQAGVVTSDPYDFKGNALRSQRQLAVEYKATLDWSQNPQPVLETEIFASSTRYDALNRPTQMVAPHSNQSNTKVNVIRPGYNEANLLQRVDAWLGQTAEPFALLDPPSANLHAVTNIDYDAKGQRMRIGYGNGVETQYAYDLKTFRLTSLTSTRPATFPADERVVQDLRYTYDPAGNITHIQDDADIQNVVFFRNQRVEPSADYTYDALYRLIEATGREHIGQLAQPQTTWNDEFRINLPQPGDGQAMRNYAEQYLYDAVGNFEKLIHQAANANWTRAYAYNEASLIEAAKKSNRLSSTTVGATTESYAYDAHGNMTSMPHLTLMLWDFKDQLNATSRQAVNATPPPDKVPETTYYIYDGAGQRVRKVTERQNGSRKEERIYLGGFEIYHKFNSNGTDVALERETLHIMDDKRRIALVETRTQGADGSSAQLVRYQFGNHLGSASLELDDKAQVISYEEYVPYGSTSYQAVRSQTETPKRYRYQGKERDEETGLDYFGARHYAPWLGRWTNPDPAGHVDGPNLYQFTRSNPIVLTDPNGTQSQSGISEESKKLLETQPEGAREYLQQHFVPAFEEARKKFGDVQASIKVTPFEEDGTKKLGISFAITRTVFEKTGVEGEGFTAVTKTIAVGSQTIAEPLQAEPSPKIGYGSVGPNIFDTPGAMSLLGINKSGGETLPIEEQPGSKALPPSSMLGIEPLARDVIPISPPQYRPPQPQPQYITPVARLLRQLPLDPARFVLSQSPQRTDRDKAFNEAMIALEKNPDDFLARQAIRDLRGVPRWAQYMDPTNKDFNFWMFIQGPGDPMSRPSNRWTPYTEAPR
jgi:RHS repeat-associated protein